MPKRPASSEPNKAPSCATTACSGAEGQSSLSAQNACSPADLPGTPEHQPLPVTPGNSPGHGGDRSSPALLLAPRKRRPFARKQQLHNLHEDGDGDMRVDLTCRESDSSDEECEAQVPKHLLSLNPLPPFPYKALVDHNNTYRSLLTRWLEDGGDPVALDDWELGLFIKSPCQHDDEPKSNFNRRTTSYYNPADHTFATVMLHRCRCLPCTARWQFFSWWQSLAEITASKSSNEDPKVRLSLVANKKNVQRDSE